MDLTTKYLGFELPHPFMPGASPLADDLDAVRRLEDSGAAAIVLNSLFEEQIEMEQHAMSEFLESPADSFAEALDYMPIQDEVSFGPDEYLAKVRRIREAVSVPVIASLNGTHGGRWLNYASMIEEAGADALELNLYLLATDAETDAATLEQRLIEMIADVKRRIEIPVAVKLSPFFTALAHAGGRMAKAGADALVVFNRFYQADLDAENLQAVRSLHLSTSEELLLRLRWLAILSSQLDTPLAVTGGVHSGLDAVKAVMSGASAVQVVSALLQHGPQHLATIRQEFTDWLESHEYESVAQMCGSMNLERSPDPAAYERANYIQVLKSWEI